MLRNRYVLDTPVKNDISRTWLRDCLSPRHSLHIQECCLRNDFTTNIVLILHRDLSYREWRYNDWCMTTKQRLSISIAIDNSTQPHETRPHLFTKRRRPAPAGVVLMGRPGRSRTCLPRTDDDNTASQLLMRYDAIANFKPMTAQLSLKAALPLVESIATAWNHSSNTEPSGTPRNFSTRSETLVGKVLSCTKSLQSSSALLLRFRCPSFSPHKLYSPGMWGAITLMAPRAYHPPEWLFDVMTILGFQWYIRDWPKKNPPCLDLGYISQMACPSPIHWVPRSRRCITSLAPRFHHLPEYPPQGDGPPQ